MNHAIERSRDPMLDLVLDSTVTLSLRLVLRGQRPRRRAAAWISLLLLLPIIISLYYN